MQLSELATDDFQKRHAHGGYPASGKPDVIKVRGPAMTLEFKNTTEAEAEKWTVNFLASKGFTRLDRISTNQSGNYEDDWVEVHVVTGKMAVLT